MVIGRIKKNEAADEGSAVTDNLTGPTSPRRLGLRAPRGERSKVLNGCQICRTPEIR